ncbi:hypothetical protein ACFP2T_26975 [Plantactinospora solaniradicis]|uniref:Secreted protein n=1 Tax=Plantactinospora solaniradicis TaxID=1723736 RepID=A0ABW1KEG1_9ACTN
MSKIEEIQMIRKIFRAAVTVSAVVPLVLAAAPSPASADNDGYVWACWAAPGGNINGGCVKFHQHGEILEVRDHLSEGWGTRGQIQKLTPDSHGVYHWVNHSHNCFDDTSIGNAGLGATTCNYAINDGIVVRVHVWASRSGDTRYDIYSPEIRA